MRQTISATILDLCSSRGDGVALRLQGDEGYRAVTWRAYREQALCFSSFLAAQGVGPGDRVLILSENGPEWTVAALAAMNRGATLVPVAHVATAEEVLPVIREARPKFSLLSVRATATQELTRVGMGAHLVWDLQQEAPLAAWTGDLAPDEVRDSGETDAVLIFTSGTTGAPKAVPLTHANILVNAGDVRDLVTVTEKDHVVSVLPLSHMFEFTTGYVVPMLVGAGITYVKNLKADDLVRALKDSRATFLIAVPLLYDIIARGLQTKFAGLPRPAGRLLTVFMAFTRLCPSLGRVLFFFVHRAFGGRIRFFVSGGARLQPETFGFFQGLGLRVLQGYGLTETSPVLTAPSPEEAEADSVGKPLRNVEVGIFSDKGERHPAGVEGELWARGPSVFRGYMNPEHDKGAFQDGWFRTGDLAVMDFRGMVRITGRLKDIIVTPAGKNVYPEEVEGAVLKSGLFLEATVLGVKGSDGGERVALVAVPDRSKFPSVCGDAEMAKTAQRAAMDACRSLSDYKNPQRIEIWFRELPKTITRKVKKHEVRKMLLETAPPAATARPGRRLDLSDRLEKAVADALQVIRRIPAEKVTTEDALVQDLGLDSLTFVELVCNVEKRFDARVDAIEFASVSTVESLLEALRRSLGTGPRTGAGKVRFVEFTPRDNLRFRYALPRRVLNAFLRAGLRIHYSLEVEGREYLLQGGPFVFTPNHASHFDTLAVMAAIPGKDVHYTFAVAAKDYFFDRSWKALGARLLINALPFDRRARVDEGMRLCREALAEGGSLVIFPEGTRSPTGQIQEFRPGVGQLLAAQSRAKAVPVYISGAWDILPKGARAPRWGVKLRVAFGRPVDFSDLPASHEGYQEAARRLEKEVRAME
ncbi:MAG: AMP-binding protein, partial [Bdellovibrionales bacterium]|nr:AMP-binding protein [Bdellovibrionales bacterium]